MKKKIERYESINFKIIAIITILLLFALQLIGANFINRLENELVTSHKDSRQTQLEFIMSVSQPYLTMIVEGEELESDVEPQEEIRNLLSDLSAAGSSSTQIVDNNLTILGTSVQTQQSLVGQRSNDSDIRQVLLTGQTVTREYIDSATGDRHWKIASPIRGNGETPSITGVAVIDSNIETVYQQVSDISLIFIQSSAVAIVISIILAYALSKEITDAIIEMEQQTERIAGGDYTGTVNVYANDEIGRLGKSINELTYRVSIAQESVDAERRRLDRVLTYMSDGVIATDKDGQVNITNQMAREMFGHNEEEMDKKNILDVLDLTEEYNIEDLYTMERGLLLEVGSQYIRANFSLIQSRDDAVKGIVAVLHDVTEAEESERERKIFVSNVSHELRTPLTSMRSYVEALNDGAWRDEEIAPHFLSVIQNETERMIRMVNDLLQLSRIDSGTDKVENEIVDLNGLFNSVLDRFDVIFTSSDYEEGKYTIIRDFPEDAVWVDLDPDRMQQVIDNIMNNAVKYSPDGGVITVRMTIRNDSTLLSVSDQGMGIPKSDQTRVFSRFFRVDKARSRAMGGTGLGLSISKEVVEQFGGRIWVRSAEGKGTTFYISLPLENSLMDEFSEGGGF